MILIPAIDIINGKCVRLTRGDYNKKTVYADDPLEVAKMFEDWGLKHLHLVDLDGAKSSHIINRKVLEKVASQTSLKIDFGGGVKTDEDIRIAFESGAAMVTGGSIAIKDPDRFLSWLNTYGSDRIILGADHQEGYIATDGWTEASQVPLKSFISEYHEKGIIHVISTDISRDGMLQGPSIGMYTDILKSLPDLKLIASGGVSCMKDVYELKKEGLFAVIIGKAIYEDKITEKEIREYLKF